MNTTLRDALQAARINRLKTRMERAWRERQNVEFPVCQGCGARHVPGIVGILQAIAGREEDEAPVPPKAH